MRKFVAFLVILALVLTSVPAFAAKGKRGASDKAYEHASDKAVFHRISDWFATRGKPDAEKKAILTEREAKRAALRAQKEAEKKKKIMEKSTRKAQNELRKQANKNKMK